MKSISVIIVWSVCMLGFTGCGQKNDTTILDLRCENRTAPVAIDNTVPHFSWKLKSGSNNRQQTAYQILIASDSISLRNDKGELWDSGKTNSSCSVMVPYGGEKLSSRSLAYWKVRVWDENGDLSQWSEINRFGVGILDKNEWCGKYIGLPEEAGSTHYPLLRKKFEVEDADKTFFLHVNSLGYHEVYLNGVKVTEDVLTPVVSQLNKRSLSVTYDITPLVKPGTNDLLVWLGRGWYRTSLFGIQHDGALVCAQIDVMQDNGQWNTLLATDKSWGGRSSEYGETGTGSWYPGHFGGETVDGRIALADLTASTLDKLAWDSVVEVEVPEHEVSPQMCEANRIQEIIQPTQIKQIADSVWVVNMGQAVTGWTKIDFSNLAAGQEVTMEYTDCLDEAGNFKPLEDNGQYSDKYIGGGKAEETFCNKFNFHVFQYIRISNLAAAPKNIVAYPIRTDYNEASSFECSDPDLNAIHDMIKHTLECLSFSGYVVDCASIERMGYGGDGNASCKTFQTMFDAAPLYMNWMQMWKDCIREDGGMPHVVPNSYTAGGGPYWCGFIITGSWQHYMNYGDTRLLERYYPVMQQWLKYVDTYTVDGLLRRWPDTDYRGWYLGDWIAPSGVDFTAQSSVDLVSNCFVSDCFATMEKIAATLGKASDADLYKERKKKINNRIQETFYDEANKQYATGSQIDMTYPMLVGVTDESLRPVIREQLIAKTRQNLNGHIGVGLVGVTILTDWAILNNEVDFLYSMLKKRDYPGYLYMIDKGATATWEHWSGERSRVHNCFNGVGAWFYQAIGGILPDENKPGYKHIIIRPQIPQGVSWAKTTKETPYGTARVNWELENNHLKIDLLIPANTTATFVAPCEATKVTVNGNKMELTGNSLPLSSGSYQISLRMNER